MPKGTTFAHELLQMIFWNYPIDGFCDAAAIPLDGVYVSLHTGDPTGGGSQSTSEIKYDPYQRILVARSTSAWNINGNTVSPRQPIVFPEMTGGDGGFVGYWVVGTSHSGAGKILYTGTVSPSIGVGVGVEPKFDVTTIVTEL